MYGNWIVAKASEVGLRHMEDDSPCQDSNGFVFNEEFGFGIAIVSDGAGSALNSHFGSKFITERGIVIFEELVKTIGFTQIFNGSPVDIIQCFKTLYADLVLYAGKNGFNVKSLAATIIVVMFGPEGLICTHIGDGRAGYQNSLGQWHSIMEPFRGDEANQTIFLTSDIWSEPLNYIRTIIIRDKIQSFTLMSDGCEAICFELNRFNKEKEIYERLNQPFAAFFDPNVKALRMLREEGKNIEEIDKLWSAFIKTGNSKFENELDDKTLILGTLTHLDQND